MIWDVRGREYPVIPLAGLLGGAGAVLAAAIGLLLNLPTSQIFWLGIAAGAGGVLLVIGSFLVDVALTAKAEGDAHRAKLRAAQRIYHAWASGSIEPPSEMKTAVYKVDGEVRPLSWLSDSDPEAARWRATLVAVFQYGRAYYTQSRGERTGLTEKDMVGDTPDHMFYGREGYILTMKIAKELGLVERINGLPTRIGDQWNWAKVITYLQTSAVLPPIKEHAPVYRPWRGLGH